MRKKKLHRLASDVNSKNSHPWVFRENSPHSQISLATAARVSLRDVRLKGTPSVAASTGFHHRPCPAQRNAHLDASYLLIPGKTKQLETTANCYCEEEQVRYYCHGTDPWLDLNCLGYLGITTVEKYLNTRYLCSAHRAKAGTTRIT